MTCKIYRTCIVLIALAALLVSGSYAATSGVTIKDAVKGNVYDFVFVVKNPSNNTTAYSITTNGNISSWITVDKANVSLNANSSVEINGKIKIPAVINSGIYTGSLKVESGGNTTPKATIIPISINVLGEPNSTSTTTKTPESTTVKTPSISTPISTPTIISTPISTPTTVSTPSSAITVAETPSKTPPKTPGFGFAITILVTFVIYAFIVRNKK